MEAYCVKCRKKVTIDNAQQVTLKMAALQQKGPVLSVVVLMFLGLEKVVNYN